MEGRWISGIIFLIITFLLFNSCYNDKEEVLYPVSFGADTTIISDVSYSEQVLPIFSENCFSCHGSTTFNTFGGGLNLEDFEILQLKVDDGELLKSIKHESGVGRMPKNGRKLSDNQINSIEIWINEGALEN